MNVATSISAAPETGIYLRKALVPFDDALARADVTDVYVNRTGELWVETLGGASERHEDSRLDDIVLMRLARQVAALCHQGLNREHPLLSASLPDGCRIQIIAPPATRGGPAIAIRKQVAVRLALEDYCAAGAFDATCTDALNDRRMIPTNVVELVQLGRLSEALAEAVRARLNILISGGTSSGKTTFLNVLLREIPTNERLILIEDTPELQVEHPNSVGLIAVRGILGEAQVSTNELVSASLRMRPDRIIVGELRGAEALAFLRAVNSGHPGSMTSIHADSPEGAVEQLALLVLQAGTTLGRLDICEYVRNTIDVFVHLGRSAGKRTIQRIALRDC